MIGRRGIIKAFGLLPVVAAGKKKEPGVPWSNQQFQLLLVSASGGFTGLFVYSPAPGNGNLIASIAAQAGSDPYGNSYSQGITTYGAAGTLVQLLSSQITLQGSGEHVAGTITENAAGATRIETGTQSVSDTAALIQLLSAAASGSIPLAKVSGALSMTEQISAPATPVGAGDLYIDSTGHLHYLGPGGTNTILANP